MNQIILIGNVGQDPESKTMQSGQTVVNCSLATNERWTDKDGEKQEKTTWHRLVVWGKLAEVFEKWVKKGDKIMVQGRLEKRKWTDRDDNEKEAVEVVVSQMELLGQVRGSRRESEPDEEEEDRRPRRRTQRTEKKPARRSSGIDLDDDIPF